MGEGIAILVSWSVTILVHIKISQQLLNNTDIHGLQMMCPNNCGGLVYSYTNSR